MPEALDVKVSSEIPAELAPKSSPEDAKLIDNPRQRVEQAVIKENEAIPETVVEEETVKEESVAEPKKPDEVIPEDKSVDPLDRIKKSVQKRIDKEVAKRKTAEEELAELREENARLKAPKTDKVADGDPTPEQVEAYIVKMREEGNVKEEVAAMRYLVKLEKDAAIKSVKEEQESIRKSSEKQLNDWRILNNDYVVYDAQGKADFKNDMSLTNQNGLLYKTALSLYQDKDLQREFYSDPDKVSGFRRAVSDAYRELHEQGLYKPAPKEKIVVEDVSSKPIRVKQQLAEPDAEASDDSTSQVSAILSDAEKVREEIKQRKKMRHTRTLA